MSANDIKAGGAYVELGVRDSKLVAGLAAARGKVEAFGKGLQGLGTALLGGGAAITAPLVAIGQQFGGMGEKLSKLRGQTGMGLQALGGLATAARGAGVPMEALGIGMKTLQLNLAKSGKESEAAFKRLGTSAKELRGMSPEAALGLLADRLAMVTSENERAALAQQLFGRSAMDLLPVLAGGSQGLNEAARKAQELGTAFDERTLDAALKLDDAFDDLEEAVLGFGRAIGGAVAPVLTPLVQDVTSVVVAMRKWIEVNPEAIEGLLKIGVALGVTGAAFVGLGTAITAAMSPAVVASAAIIGIGTALLGVLDVLGVTNTGFGEVFNSIRLGGVGLATWFGEISLALQRGFNLAFDTVTDAGQWFWRKAESMALQGARTLLWLPEQFASLWGLAIKGIVSALNGLIGVWNATAGKMNAGLKINTQIDAEKFNIGAMASGQLAQARQTIGTYDNQSQRLYEQDGARNQAYRAQRDRLLGQDVARLRDKDGGGGPAWGIDTGRMKAALETVGGNIWEQIEKGFGALKTGLGANMPTTAAATATPFGAPAGGALGPEQQLEKPTMSAIGTFSGYGGGLLAASGIFNQQLAEQKETNQKLNTLIRHTAESSSGTLR